MIQLQHSDSLQPLQAIEIDYAILDLQTKLRTELNWLSHAYGRAYRIDKQGEEKRLVLPEVYIGNTDGKYTLLPTTPDNDKKAVSYFVVEKEKQVKYEPNGSNYLSWNVGAIFWANLEEINLDLAKNEDFTQVLIKEVRNVITNKLLGVGYRCEIVEVQREVNEIFKEFTLQDRRYVVMPFTAFRFNLVITLREECGLSSDRGNAIRNNISKQEICQYIVPYLDFSGLDFDCLTEQQKNDLTLRLTPILSQEKGR